MWWCIPLIHVLARQRPMSLNGFEVSLMYSEFRPAKGYIHSETLSQTTWQIDRKHRMHRNQRVQSCGEHCHPPSPSSRVSTNGDSTEGWSRGCCCSSHGVEGPCTAVRQGMKSEKEQTLCWQETLLTAWKIMKIHRLAALPLTECI